jgi:hypothetical protein
VGSDEFVLTRQGIPGLMIAEPKPARRAQVALTPHKCDICLEECVITFPSHLAAEIKYDKTFLVHKGNNVGE